MRLESLLFTYCVVIVIASMAGGWLPALMKMTHLRTQLLMSFVSGLMLGIATLHLFPHATVELNSASKAGTGALCGILSMFLLIRLFHVHQHDAPAIESGKAEQLSHVHDHAAGCDHDHSHHKPHNHANAGWGWLAMLFGLGLHTLIDGVALAASVVADAQHGSWLPLAGVGTFLAVALHKPLDAFSITSVMQKGGWTPGQRTLANMTFAMACPIGAALFYFGVMRIDGGSTYLGWGLAVSAGFFICISLADLLPEVAFHDHDRGKLTAALLIGVALAVAVENLPGHRHIAPKSSTTINTVEPSSDTAELPVIKPSPTEAND
ncbi:ZIP family metal transporter [Rubripirellula reticaptiva]|uniref:Zinc transporter ZupT n=1 Tax=Rubripirellula reticaptiva TaxID=2528013 RepID=A0A5C6EU50_9BACT|nr:ZIP family metal transporter [Rubripirellula reticaptiva]TWU51637.1 zinc transporter ZupT [Rubripirellula reticaptiva]